jgi:DNA polymerase-4
MEPVKTKAALSAEPASIILLADIDAFFAQVEQILRPPLRGRPVVVGGLVTDRSVVASASYEARARGVRTAMPIVQAHRLCPDAVFLRGDYHAYARFSRAMMDLCRRYTPLVEPMSLDEAYLDVTGCRRLFETRGIIGAKGGTAAAPLPAAAHPQDDNICDCAWPLEAADHLKRTLRRELDLAVTIGVGANRLVAKVACDYAKPNGVAWIRPGGEEPFLAPLPLKNLPGIGPRTAERLARYNLHRIGDLARIPQAMLAGQFGPSAETLAARARGVDPTPVSADPGGPKSISRETTFEANLIDRTAMKAMLYYLLERACRRLREHGLLARTVTVKVRYADFQTPARSRSLPTLSDHDNDFWPVASHLFDQVHTRRVSVRLVGVALSHFAPAGRQMNLFAETAYDRRGRFYRSLDRVRERFGFGALATGRAIELLETHERDEHGFRLRTACLSQ